MPTPTPAPIRILVVSARRGKLGAMRSLFTAAGYDTLQYHSVPHDDRPPCAVLIEGMVQTFHPQLLVLDITVGKEDAGWQGIQALQVQPGCAALPWVVCIAASAFAHKLVPHLVLRGVRVVLKPFTSADLLRHVWAACPPTTPVTPIAPPTPPTSAPAVLPAAEPPEQAEPPEPPTLPEPPAPGQSSTEGSNRRRRRRPAS